MQQNRLSGRAPTEPTDGSSAYALLQTPQLQWGLLQGGEGREGKREGTKGGWQFPLPQSPVPILLSISSYI